MTLHKAAVYSASVSRTSSSGRARSLALAASVAIVAIAGAGLAQQSGALAQAPPAPSAPSADISGLWIDHTGRGAVEFGPCAAPATGKICGHIAWLQTTVDERGRPLVDHKNPDTRKQRQPICGVQVIGDLARVGQTSAGGVWGNGWIYDPEKGESFDVEVKLLAPDRLSVMGYAGFKFLSETFIWKRAPATTAAARCAPSRV